MIDWCYTPMVQSGGNFNLTPGTENNDSFLDFGTIICSLGCRYKFYCANIARTYFVDPSKEQEEAYEALSNLHDHVMSLLKPGAKANSIYNDAKKYLEEKSPKYVNNFTAKNVGFGVSEKFNFFFF